MPAANPTLFTDAVTLINQYIEENSTNSVSSSSLRGLILSILNYMENNEPPTTGFTPVTISDMRGWIDEYLVNNDTNFVTPTTINFLLQQLLNYYASQETVSLSLYTHTTIDVVEYLTNKFFVDNDVNLISVSKVRYIFHRWLDYITTLYNDIISVEHNTDIIINHTYLTADITSGYQLYVKVTSMARWGTGGHVHFPDAKDIRFTVTGHSTNLAWELLSYVAATGEVEAIVYIPASQTVSASVDTSITMHYGSATDFSVYRNISLNNPWPNYSSVWHFNQPTGWDDSTPTGSILSPVATPPTLSSPGIADWMFDFASLSPIVALANIAYEVPCGTWSCWIRTTDMSSGLKLIMGLFDTTGNHGIAILLTGGSVVFKIADSTPIVVSPTFGTVADGQWHKITLTFGNIGTGVTTNLFVDGVATPPLTIYPAYTFTFDAIQPFQIGADSISGYGHFVGQIDEVRLYGSPSSNISISNVQDLADVGNLKHPGDVSAPAFYSVGAEY